MREHTEYLFAGVMDLDNADEFVQPGNYREAYGIVNGKSSEGGTVRIMKGNYQFPITLPSGSNTCIGAYEDKRRQSCIFLVWNSNSNHTIWRWFPNEQDLNNLNALGRIEKLAQDELFNFVRYWHINHIELIDDKYLIWTDARSDKFQIVGNPVRKFDIDRASKYQKVKVYEMYAGIPNQGQFPNGFDLLMTITEDDGTVIWPTTEFHQLYGYYNDPEGALEEIAQQINSYAVANELPVEAEYCGCKVVITTQLPEINVNITTSVSGYHFIIVPLNTYPNLTEEMINLQRNPPRFEPSVLYGNDPDVAYNYVNRKLFQFRVRYHYEDYSKSAWGPISMIPLPLDASGTILDSLNHIIVDFTEDILNTQEGLCVIRKVEIAFREGNEGLFKTADIIEVCSIGYGQNLYRFFNDKVYATVESDESGTIGSQTLKLFDDLPELAGGLVAVSDKDGNSRLVLGANERGKNSPDCADITFEVTTETPESCLINIKGKIEINHYDTDPYKFGSVWPDHLLIDGFVVYLAGTSYFGISDSFTVTPTGEFEITGVPPGKYFLRVANFKCCNDDTNGSKHNLNNGLEWQKTSSPLIDCAGSLDDTGVPYERYLDLTTAPGGDFDLMTEAGYGPIIIENWEHLVTPYIGAEFYVLDNQADTSTNDLRKGSIGMERQKVQFEYIDGLSVPNPGTEVILETDHNGYAWYTYIPVEPKNDQYIFDIKLYAADACNPGDPEVQVTVEAWLASGGPPDEDIWLSLFSNTEALYDFLMTGPLPLGNSESMLAIFNIDTAVAENNKTTVHGTIKDLSGVGVENVVVCLERNGRAEPTDPDGEYSISAWVPWDSADSFRTDRLVYTYPSDTCYDYPPSPDEMELVIGEYCDTVDFDTFFEVGDIVLPFSGAILQLGKYLKSGGLYQTGIVYEDTLGRKSTVVRGPDLYIPFHTEAGVYERPVVNWEINSNPPDWADRYRIVRTRDGIYRRFFQWVVEEVLYEIITDITTTPTPTTYGANDATHIFLRISSQTDPDQTDDVALFFFRDTNQFGFEPEQGDRVRIILDETGAITGVGVIWDFEIVGRYIDGNDYYAVIKADNIGFEIKDNFLVEFYTPNQLEEVVYYEAGDSYPIVDAGGDPAHGGQTQDQIPGVQPAQGRLKGGDTYWRDRNFTVSAAVSFTYNTENKNFSDVFQSEDEDIGRPNVYDPDYKKQYLFNELALSDVYIPTSYLNGLPSFRSLEKQPIDRDFGPIRKLTILGSTLVAICEHKTQPIYIGQSQIMGLDGNQMIVRADQILNIANQTVHDYGTQHPESVVSEEGFVKGWDASKGTVWQYSQNGQIPIIQGLEQFFHARGRQADLLYVEDPSQTLMWCPAGYDRKRSTYWLTFVQRDTREDTDLFTVCYDDIKNGWNTFQLFHPEHYSRVGLWFVQFRGGKLYIAEEGAVAGTFFGAAKEPSIKFVVNPNPNTIKDWHNIEVLANDQWIANPITAPANSLYLAGQQSRLKTARWSRYNGKWCADFLRDLSDPAFNALTPTAVREATALMNGRVLKSNVLSIKLIPIGKTVTDKFGDTWLKIVSIEWTPAFDTK